VDHQNALWAGSSGDFLARFREDRWEPVDIPPHLKHSAYLRALWQDREGRIWIGTDTEAVRLDGTGWKSFSTTDGMSNGDVRLFYEDRQGDMWFGTYGGGLNRLKDGTIKAFPTPRGRHNNCAWWIHEDSDGVFWVGTEEGLNRFEPWNGRSITFTTEQGLGENVVNNIQEDSSGYLWLSGLRGIYRVSRAQLNAEAAKERPRVQVLALGEADGMLTSECNGGDNQPGGLTGRDGRIWFPTKQGVVVIDPKEFRRNEVQPPVVIEQVKANDEVIYGDDLKSKVQSPKSNVGEERLVAPAALPMGTQPNSHSELRTPNSAPPIRLRPGHGRVLEIHYTGNSLVAPEKVTFKYRLVGYDLAWRDVGDQRVAFYTNLRPDKYRFEVLAANPHGVWSLNPATFAFSLAPHFWERPVFYILCGVVAVGLAAAVQAYRLRWQHRLLKLDEQRALATERTRIARDLHDDLGTALTGLALQLDVAGRDARAAPPLAERLGETARHTRDLAERMREVVWTVNPLCDTVQSLVNFLEQQVSQFLRGDLFQVRLDFPEDIPDLPMGAEARHQLALSVREALTNVVRHAQATEVVMSLAIEAGPPGARSLLVRVKDNGRGFGGSNGAGHGLANMRSRMQQVGGTFECVSKPGDGTVVTFRMNLS
jgi:signal transduction histidine kinase/streptogramin lyase